jgi:hypothetical protein
MKKQNTEISRMAIAIELQNRFPDLPLLIDPSYYRRSRHDSGNARGLRFEL